MPESLLVTISRTRSFHLSRELQIKPAVTFINTLNTSRLKNLYYTRIGIYREFYFIVVAILRYNALVIMRKKSQM